ncbi:hypothetical protein BS329_29235 [Amycolatopsis coloradensis]|uniref:Uncharacterized protein n=1 Tax=Amycolatopsis coloradensis TaxID=76021 RepID=A0A1R0KKK7_9PSEU|nr:hypothetical protein BS329_29235 [Amycolatopsis coloradensis]
MTDEMLTTEPPVSSRDGAAATVSAWAVETVKRKDSSRNSVLVSSSGRVAQTSPRRSRVRRR